MTDLYLIAHKVRSEPAFDVACHMECPICHGAAETDGVDVSIGCTECDGLGYWWIIPTSGHRAYPIMWWQINQLKAADGYDDPSNEAFKMLPAWASLPDHYIAEPAPRAAKAKPPSGLAALLAPKPMNIPRRGF